MTNQEPVRNYLPFNGDARTRKSWADKAKRRWAAGLGRKSSEKIRAYNAVMTAIRNRSLLRPEHCGKCHIKCTPCAHHEDYSKPLDVAWLCKGCHGRLHADRRMGRAE